MVLGKHPVAFASHLAHTLSVYRSQIHSACLPPGQKLQRAAGILPRFLQQVIQGQAAGRLQQRQLPVQSRLQYRRQRALGSPAHTDRLCLQHSSGEIGRQIGGMGKQLPLHLGHCTAQHCRLLRLLPQQIDQLFQRRKHRVLSQWTEHHQARQTGLPLLVRHTIRLTSALRPGLHW